jgi:hypothetical protein
MQKKQMNPALKQSSRTDSLKCKINLQLMTAISVLKLGQAA